MEILVPLLVLVVGVIFSIAVAVFYLGCLGGTMAAFANKRIVWGIASFAFPPLSLLFGLRNRELVGWAWGFMLKGGAVVMVMLLLGWGGLKLLPEPVNSTGQLMERMLPAPQQPSAPAQ